MLTFSPKHRHPTNDYGFIWGRFGDTLVKKIEITKYYNRENLALDVGGRQDSKKLVKFLGKCNGKTDR